MKRLWRWTNCVFRAAFSKVVSSVDRSDVQFLVGLLLLYYGMRQLSNAYALVVVGSILILMALSNDILTILSIVFLRRGPEETE